MFETTTRKTCRICNYSDLQNIHSFGEMYVSNFVSNLKDKHISAPLDLVYCNNCSLVQLKHTAPQELLYSKFYWYRSGVNEFMINSLKDIYNNIIDLKVLQDNDIILDIGANDGTLLNFFDKKKYVTIGCEPAENLINSLNNKCTYVIDDFWSNDAFNNVIESKKPKNKKAKIITAIGMFYDLEDPNIFIGDIEKALDDDGIFIAQLMCLDSMLRTNDLGNICHEHLEYYSFDSLKYLYEKNGLEITNITKNLVNGESYRIFAKKLDKGSIKYEENTSLNDILEFVKNIQKIKINLNKFIEEELKKNKKIFVYGASTKGNTILQYFGIDNNKIPYAADRSPEKWGKYTVGSGIKIISEQEARDQNPDYFLVLPWSFLDNFIERENEWRKKGGKFIVPFPSLRII